MCALWVDKPLSGAASRLPVEEPPSLSPPSVTCSLLTPSHFQGPGEPGDEYQVTRKPLLGQFLDHRMTQRPSQGLRVCPQSSLAEEASWSCGWPERFFLETHLPCP